MKITNSKDYITSAMSENSFSGSVLTQYEKDSLKVKSYGYAIVQNKLQTAVIHIL